MLATNHKVYNDFAEYLWFHFERDNMAMGGGISAMPSMHVALALWSLFAARSIDTRLTIPFAVYVTVIWLASVASGWHWASDGLASILAVLLIQWLYVVAMEMGKRSPAGNQAVDDPRLGTLPR